MTQENNNPRMISKPGASPILALFLSLFVYGTGHVYNGQTVKWPVVLLLTFIGSALCVLPGIFILVLSLIDSYQIAERLSQGESIPENEYSLPLLYNIAKVIDRTATCSHA